MFCLKLQAIEGLTGSTAQRILASMQVLLPLILMDFILMMWRLPLTMKGWRFVRVTTVLNL